MATGTTRPSMASSRMASGFPSGVVTPLFPKLARREAEKPVTLTPSAFQKEMSLTTKQRLASTREMSLPRIVQRQDMSETSDHKLSAVAPDQTLFDPFPSEVVFQNYVPHKVCEMPLVLRNRDMVPRLVKVTMESSPYFKLVGPSGVCRKVPPGMCSTLRIIFTPGENKDYFHCLLCTTEREEFIVPIRAIGARAVLDFPDQLDFSVCPVKYSTQKTLMVRNLGNREARYQISTQSPFSVLPTMGTLGIGDTLQVTVEFHPLQTGDHCASLVVHYGTGEDTHTSLHGSAVNVHIRLDRNSVTVEKTYITLSNQSTVRIHNHSNIPARFQWKAFATQEEEEQLKQRLCHMLCQQENAQADNFLEWSRADTTRGERLSLLSHAFQRERAKVQRDPMLFFDNIFTIKPEEGEVWPNSSAEVSVIFRPREARVYKHAVYCDISGRETRLPLRLIGEGLGPRLHFQFEELDIGKVSVISRHRYEAILVNKGPIEGLFSLIPPTTAVGSCFTFLPQQGIIAPDGLQAISISFCTTIPGEFKEEFRFSVTKGPKPVTLTIRGYVIGPTFHFNVRALHFGDIPFGFPHTLSCCLTNTSLMPMAFTLRIPGDGSGEPSLTSSGQVSSNTHPPWRKGAQALLQPMEFTITPCRGTICSQAFQDIQVTLCSNTVGQYKMELVVDVDGVGKKVSVLPLTARCVVPPLRALNPVMAFGRCYLKVPYQKMLKLVNDSDFPGCYRVLPQEHKEDAAVLYFTPEPCGIIKAHSSKEIPFILETQLLGEHDITADVTVFGSEEPPLQIHLESTGQGPVVYVYPTEINFGTIPVVQDISQTLHLSNQSVIPAVFWIEMAGTCSRWRTEPSKGVIPPETEVSVTVTANLDDTGKFEDKVKLFIENSHVNIIPVQAVGVGTTIVTDKPFSPELNLKPHFSLSPCWYRFKMTNKGRHTHQLFWTTEGFSISQQRRALGTTKGKDTSQAPKPTGPVFKLQPPQMELVPGQTKDMVLEGFSSTPQKVKERLLCHAIVGREKRKKQIMQVDVNCEFIFPLVQISSRAIMFRVEKWPSDVLTLLYKPLSLKNASSLPLTIVLDLKKPFLICGVDQQPLPEDAQPIKLEVGEEFHLHIQFNPAYKEDLKSRVAEKTLNMRFMEHPHEEQITVRGEVYFPNLHIQTEALDFGCILNDTERVCCVVMTNCSPIPVQYKWSFQTDSQDNTIRFTPSPPEFKPKPPKKDSLKYSALSRKQFSAESVEEPTKAPEAVPDPAPQPAASEDVLGAEQDSVPQSAGSEDVLGAEQDSAQHSASSEDALGAEQDSAQHSEASDDALEAEQDPAPQPAGLEDALEAEQDPALQPAGSEDALEAEQDSAPQPAGSEDALGEEQDPALQPAGSEDSLETKVLPSTAGEPQSPETMQGLRRLMGVEHLALGIEEVFDVQPLSGVLQPGESQQVLFTFFGHANVVARVAALCHVEGGPTYEVLLSGEASCLSYHLDTCDIDFGLQLFNKVIQGEVTLQNTGMIGFTYKVLNPSTAKADSPLPGEPVVVPSTAYIDPGKEQVLKIYYLPGVVGVFCRTLQIQVGHLTPAEISLKGEGTFLRISLDLPWDVKGSKKFEKILKEIKENLKEDSQSDEADVLSEPASVDPSMDHPGIKEQQHLLAPGNEKYKEILKETIEKQEEEMQMHKGVAIVEASEETSKEMSEETSEQSSEESSEELSEESSVESSTESSMESSIESSLESSVKSSMESSVKSSMESSMESSTESSMEFSKKPSEEPSEADSGTDFGIVWDTWVQREMEQMLIEQCVLEQQAIVASHPPKLRGFDKSIRQKLVEIELPVYILDMGSVVRGNTKRHTVNITNTGLLPVSFRIEKRVLQNKGFSLDLDQVQSLPYCNTERIEVLFDSTNLPVGEVHVSLPIKVTGGYTVQIRLSATVTEDCIQEKKTPDLLSSLPPTRSGRRKRRDNQRSKFVFKRVVKAEGPAKDGEMESASKEPN